MFAMVKPIFPKEKFPPQQHFMRQLKNESAHGDCSKATYCCSQYGASFRDGLDINNLDQAYSNHTLASLTVHQVGTAMAASSLEHS